MKASTEVRTVTTREAQHHLTRVLAMVEKGEEVIITRRGKQVARMSRIDDDAKEREVDWASWANEQKGHLAEMPEVGENPILAERQEYRT